MNTSLTRRLRRTAQVACTTAALFGLISAPVWAAKDVVIAVSNTLSTLDLHDANDTLSQAVNKTYYQGLYGFDKDLKLHPLLAEGHTVAPDGLTYTFILKKGIKFHDGTPFTAESVKATFDRVTNPDNKHRRFTQFSVIDSVEVLADHVVKIKLKRPFSAFINTMAHPSAGIMSAAAIKKYGKDIAFNPVGTGPFKFVEWQKTDYLKVQKNPDYWKPGLPKVDTITFKPVPDNNTRTAVLQTGEAHMINPLAYEQVEVIKQRPEIETVVAPGIFANYLTFNHTRKPFNDLRVRQAINYAINKQAFAKVVYNGFAAPLEAQVPPGVDFSHKTGPWPYDLAKARQLLKEAGYPSGFETELWSGNTTTAIKASQFLQQQLAQVGIKAKLSALETGQRIQRMEAVQKPEDAQSQLYFGGWSASTGEADWGTRPLLGSAAHPPRGFNLGYYKNAAFDEAITSALSALERKDKAAFYKTAQEVAWKDAAWGFLVTTKTVYAHSKKLSGAYIMPDGSMHLEQIDLK